MKLRTKTTLFFAIFFITVTSVIVFYIDNVVGATFKQQTTQNFRIIAEQSEGTYFAFLNSMKVRVVDWTSDQTIQQISKNILTAHKNSIERARYAKEFTQYLSERKMPYDKTIVLAELFDRDGIVIASTQPNRIGANEKREDALHKAERFNDAINSRAGEVFFDVTRFDEVSNKPITKTFSRLSEIGSDGKLQPIEAVFVVYFANMQELAEAIGASSASTQVIKTTNRISTHAFFESYKSSDIYFVNSENLIISPSRNMKNILLRQKAESLPVRECFENNKEINEEYDNYQGTSVLGASMCFKDNGLVLLVEVQKDEVFAPLSTLTRLVFAGGISVVTLGVLISILFVRRPLAHLQRIVLAAERVSEGDLDTQVSVNTKDEIGYLASIFNTMVSSLRTAKNELELSRREVEEKAASLEKDVVIHQQQEKFLEESKKATLNLLEDSWRAKEKLEEEGNKLETILASVGDGLLLIDPEYKIVLVNTKLLEIFSMSREELLDQDLRTIMKIYKKKEYLDVGKWPIEEMFLTKKAFTTTLEDNFYITTKGRVSQLPVTLSIAPLLGRFTGAVIVIRDVTADSELDEAKSGFISVASHQLRTPLTSIRWYSEMLLSLDAGPLNETQKDFMNEVHGGAERLYQTVDLLLGISRVESGKMKADRKPIDLGVFTGEITKELAPQIDEKELALTVVAPDRAPVIVWLDSLTLRQVILNLISNAIRYTNDKGTVEIKWNISEDGREIVYSVRDNGIGIPEAQRGRIFSKFFRAENARAQVPDGSGLGLALVKDLVVSWGGRVWFESEEGKGTTFFFTVPLFTRVADIDEHANIEVTK